MPHHRRALITVLAALSLFYVYRLFSTSQSAGSPSWIRRGRDDDNVLNSTLGFGEMFVINLPLRRDRRDAMTIAGAVSNFNLTFLEGLTGDSVDSSSSTTKSGGRTAASSHSALAGARGSWRSHMNALQTIVEQGLGSALVLEDDVDWDVRLKAQMRTFAAASRIWLSTEEERRKRVSPTQGPKGAKSRLGERQQQQYDSVAESLIPLRSDSEPDHGERAMSDQPKRATIPLSSNILSSTLGQRNPTASPYGADWDVLWLGHCGADLPIAAQEGPLSSKDTFPPSLTISISDDVTVPAPKHLKPHPFALRDRLADAYPAHTRVVHAATGNVCSLAYAVSQRGARKLLWRFSQAGFVDQWDLMLRDYCMGEYEDGDSREDEPGEEEQKMGHTSPVCLTVQPPLISHRYAGEEGGASVSNIRGQGGGLARAKKGTPYVRLSVQENLRRLVAGYSIDELVDQLPDEGDTLW
ncbi:hypothetical protein GGS24DRAFT_48992 [Hypoxylon argillaceum]|nr:hypothetical protein GGS24DRAFT_48992 [Hypoxylon argillaceum]